MAKSHAHERPFARVRLAGLPEVIGGASRVWRVSMIS
jgi:hypothetical protein